MNETNGYEVFALYNSLKLHFTSKSYDFFKYNGKSNVSKDAFMLRKDKYSFYKLARKYHINEVRDFYVSNMMHKPNVWIGELLDDDSDSRYKEYQKVLQSLAYFFEQDLDMLLDVVNTPEDMLKVVDGQYPILLQYVMREKIKIQTVVILNDIMKFMPMWKRKISDDIIFPEYALKIEKFSPFLDYDVEKMKKLILSKVKVQA